MEQATKTNKEPAMLQASGMNLLGSSIVISIIRLIYIIVYLFRRSSIVVYVACSL